LFDTGGHNVRTFMVRAVNQQINTPVTPDDRIWPIVIFSGRFIADGRCMGSPTRNQPRSRARRAGRTSRWGA
jgi:hypothetical protein